MNLPPHDTQRICKDGSVVLRVSWEVYKENASLYIAWAGEADGQMVSVFREGDEHACIFMGRNNYRPEMDPELEEELRELGCSEELLEWLR